MNKLLLILDVTILSIFEHITGWCLINFNGKYNNGNILFELLSGKLLCYATSRRLYICNEKGNFHVAGPNVTLCTL